MAATHKMVNGIAVPLSPEEAAAIEAEWAAWSAEDELAYQDSLHPERTDLRQQAGAAVQALDTYLAIADTATAAQIRDQVKRLSQMMRKVIVRLVQVD